MSPRPAVPMFAWGVEAGRGACGVWGSAVGAIGCGLVAGTGLGAAQAVRDRARTRLRIFCQGFAVGLGIVFIIGQG